MGEDRLQPGGEGWTRISQTPDKLSGGPILRDLLIEWGKEPVSESNLRPRVVLNTQVWLPTMNGDERSYLFKVSKLTPEDIARQKLWRDQDSYTSRTIKMKREGTQPDTFSPPGDVSYDGFSSVGSGDSYRERWILGREKAPALELNS